MDFILRTRHGHFWVKFLDFFFFFFEPKKIFIEFYLVITAFSFVSANLFRSPIDSEKKVD